MKSSIFTLIRTVAVFTILLCIAAGVVVFAEGKTVSKQSTSDSVDGTIEYTVTKGDTLYGISRRFGISIDDLCRANGITKSTVLKAGQKITILLTTPGDAQKADDDTHGAKSSAPQIDSTPNQNNDSAERKYDTYTVQKGDTFWHIAQINDMSVDELKKLNGLKEESTLKAGQKLKVPVTIVDTSKTELPDLTTSDPRTYSDKKGDSTLVWPVKKPTVTYIKGKVSGVQLTAAKNEAVTAIRAGTVTSCGNYRGYGQVVFVLSKTGLVYAYCGLGSVKVTRGQYVVFGDVVGTAGTDSIKGTPQILFMVYQKGAPMDPSAAPRG